MAASAVFHCGGRAEPLHIQQRKQIEVYREAWTQAGNTRAIFGRSYAAEVRPSPRQCRLGRVAHLWSLS